MPRSAQQVIDAYFDAAAPRLIGGTNSAREYAYENSARAERHRDAEEEAF